jgi:hypothetical protein
VRQERDALAGADAVSLQVRHARAHALAQLPVAEPPSAIDDGLAPGEALGGGEDFPDVAVRLCHGRDIGQRAVRRREHP